MRTAVIAGTVLALVTVAPLFGREADVSVPVEGTAAGSALRPVMTRRYVMSGKVTPPSALTVHDVDATLDRVRHETSAVATRSMPLPAGARPGFLTAVAELLDQTVRGVRDHADTRTLTRPRLTYVFGQGSYELQL